MKLLLDAYLAVIDRVKTGGFFPDDLSVDGYLVLDSKKSSERISERTPEGWSSRKIQIYFSVVQSPENLVRAAQVLLPFFYNLDLSARFLLNPSKPSRSLRSLSSAASSALEEGQSGQEIALEIDLDKINLEGLKDILLATWGFLSLHGLSASLGYCQTPAGHQEIELFMKEGVKIRAPFSYVISEVLSIESGALAGAGAPAGASARNSAVLGDLKITEEDLSAYDLGFSLMIIDVHRSRDKKTEGSLLELKPLNPIVENNFLRDGEPLTLSLLEVSFSRKKHALLRKLQYLENAFVLITGNHGRIRYVTTGRHGSFLASHNIQYSDRQLNDIKALKDFYLKLIQSELSSKKGLLLGFFGLLKEVVKSSHLVDFNRTRYRTAWRAMTGTRKEITRCLLAAPTMVFLKSHSEPSSMRETGGSSVSGLDRK